ncbi:hypothetical protein [Kitasatospora sp. NPDC051914]|uniref:hypothetical protein n=1 Tax=Kitasatospora sp. NPDC051914 TaxID=3154945 RepID=UPI00343D4F5F
MISRGPKDEGAGGPVVVEIEGVTVPATFARLPEAVAAVWEAMRALPLGNTQYEAYRYFFTRHDAADRVTDFLRRDGYLSLSFTMQGRPHTVRVSPASPGGSSST